LVSSAQTQVVYATSGIIQTPIGYTAQGSTGTVTSIATGLGLSGGTITTTGTLVNTKPDTGICVSTGLSISRSLNQNTLTNTKPDTGISVGIGLSIGRSLNQRTLTNTLPDTALVVTTSTGLTKTNSLSVNTIAIGKVPVANGGTGRTAPNYYFLTVSAPGTITTTTVEAVGLSHSLSPLTTNSSNDLYICITGAWTNATVADAATIGLYYGDAASASAPANATVMSTVTGATLVGTAISLTKFGTASGGQSFSLQGIVHGLTTSHTYWFDVGVSSASGTVITVSDVNISAFEL